MKDMELDVFGLLETDLYRPVFGNRDLWVFDLSWPNGCKSILADWEILTSWIWCAGRGSYRRNWDT